MSQPQTSDELEYFVEVAIVGDFSQIWAPLCSCRSLQEAMRIAEDRGNEDNTQHRVVLRKVVAVFNGDVDA